MPKTLRTLLLLICFLCGTSILLAQTKEQKELEAKRAQIQQEIREINSLLFKSKKEEKTVLEQVENLEFRIRATENLIRVTNQQANLLTREINNNTRRISDLRQELEELKEDYAELIRRSYKSKSEQNRVMFLLSSESFLQTYKRVQYMKQYADHRKRQGETIQEKALELQELNSQLSEQKKEKDALVAENRITAAGLYKEQEEQKKLIATLKQQEGKYIAQVRKREQEAAEVDRQIEKLIRQAIAEANRRAAAEAAARGEKLETEGSSTSFALTAEAKALAASFASNKGKLPWPVERGIVTQRPGTRRHPQFPNVTVKNSGVEITTEKDAKARAVFDGTVLQIQQYKGGALAVHVNHGNYITIYSNLASVTVKKGDKVKTKQNLGTIYTSPLVNKTILKFMVYQNTTLLDPTHWIYKM